MIKLLKQFQKCWASEVEIPTRSNLQAPLKDWHVGAAIRKLASGKASGIPVLLHLVAAAMLAEPDSNKPNLKTEFDSKLEHLTAI